MIDQSGLYPNTSSYSRKSEDEFWIDAPVHGLHVLKSVCGLVSEAMLEKILAQEAGSGNYLMNPSLRLDYDPDSGFSWVSCPKDEWAQRLDVVQ